MAKIITKTPQPGWVAPKVPQTPPSWQQDPNSKLYAETIYKALTPKPSGPSEGEKAMYFSGLAKQQVANPTPFDATYQNAVSGINRQTGDTLANLQYEEGQLSPTYGYQTDTAGNVTVDPSNPFSKAALLQRSYDQGQTGTTNRMAAQGQLYAGSTQNALNQGTFQNQSATDALKRTYQQALQGVRQRRTSALTTQSINTNNAYGDAVQRALANRPDPATVETPWQQDPNANAYATAIYKALTAQQQAAKGPTSGPHITYPTPKVPKGKTPIKKPTEGLKTGRKGIY